MPPPGRAVDQRLRRRPRIESRNDVKKIWMPTIDERRRQDREPLLAERAEAAVDPDRDDDGAEHDAGEQHCAAEQQPVLEAEARAPAIEPRVLARRGSRRRRRARTARARRPASPTIISSAPRDHRVDVPRAAEDVELGERRDRDQRAEERASAPREAGTGGRAVDEQEAQVAPAVAEAGELRLAAARVVLDRELADVEASPSPPG